MSFGPLYVEVKDDTTFKIVLEPFFYHKNASAYYKVPVGFETDFASVPRWGWIYALLGNTAYKPAVIHDWCYYSDLMCRRDADNVLLDAMNDYGVWWWRRWPIYLGVRIGGWWAWMWHRRAGHSAKDYD